MNTTLSTSTRRMMREAMADSLSRHGEPPLGKGSTTRYGADSAVRFGRRVTGEYYVTHEWRVPESYDDDHLSRTGGLLPGVPSQSVTVMESSIEELWARLSE